MAPQKSILRAMAVPRFTNQWFCGLVCLILLAVGLWLDYRSGEHQLEFEDRIIPPREVKDSPTVIQLVKVPAIAAWERVASNVCYIFGISLFVSVVVMRSIEEARQAEQTKIIEKLREKVQEDVLEATMGKFIPREIVSVVKRDVLERSIVVARGRWEFDFIREKDRIKLETTTSYQLVNTKEQEVTEERTITMRPIESGGLKTFIFRVGDKDVIAYDSAKEPPQNFKIEEANGTSKMKHSMTIPGGGSAEMFASYVDYYHLPVSDVIFAKHPTQELEILVRYPSDLIFNLNSFATTPCEPFRVEEGRADYRFKGALLPGQGVAYLLNDQAERKDEKTTV